MHPPDARPRTPARDFVPCTPYVRAYREHSVSHQGSLLALGTPAELLQFIYYCSLFYALLDREKVDDAIAFYVV